jgi:hypothetical protein
MLKPSDLFAGLTVFILAVVAALGLSFDSPVNRILAPGVMTPGHENISCRACHKPAPGTIRQQIQANLRYWVGLRAEGADFGNAPVTATACASCHVRKADTHPTYRFKEPRFLDAVNRLDARDCLTCHIEHRDRRVLAKADECQLCHDRLVVKNDPLDAPHRTLISNADWASCLGCHDYHGNHERKAQTAFADRYSRSAIDSYMGDGPSPYGKAKKEKAKQP